MKLFYVATDYARKDQARVLADALIEETDGDLGCSARWIYNQPTYKEGGLGGELDSESAAAALKVAQEDLEDIAVADIFIQLTSGEKARGGRHVELGFALAVAHAQSVVDGNPLKIVVVGPREHAFHYHPLVTHIPAVLDASGIAELLEVLS